MAAVGQVGSADWRGVNVKALTQASLVSITSASLATALVALCGIPLGFLLARVPGRWMALLGFVVQLPLALPPLASGVLLLFLLGYASPLGRLDRWAGLTDSFVGIVLAEAFVAAPFLIIAARSAFAGVDPVLEDVAATLGHPPGAVFRRVSLALASLPWHLGRSAADLATRFRRVRRDGDGRLSPPTRPVPRFDRPRRHPGLAIRRVRASLGGHSDAESNGRGPMSRTPGHRLSIRIDLATGGRIGPGKVALLEAIGETGSISAAGRAMKMSYRRAWQLVVDLNGNLGGQPRRRDGRRRRARWGGPLDGGRANAGPAIPGCRAGSARHRPDPSHGAGRDRRAEGTGTNRLHSGCPAALLVIAADEATPARCCRSL